MRELVRNDAGAVPAGAAGRAVRAPRGGCGRRQTGREHEWVAFAAALPSADLLHFSQTSPKALACRAGPGALGVGVWGGLQRGAPELRDSGFSLRGSGARGRRCRNRTARQVLLWRLFLW